MSSSTVALLSRKSIGKLGEKVNDKAASGYSSFAMKQMEKMGWKGGGLGKDEDGEQSYIKIAKREEAMGLGAETLPEESATDGWWFDAFSTNLKSFKKKKDKKEKKEKKEKKRSRNEGEEEDEEQQKKKRKKEKKDKKEKKEANEAPSFEELFKATGGKRLGMRARCDQPGKIRRTEE